MSCFHPLHQYYQKYSDGSEKHIFVDDNSVLPFTDGNGHIWWCSRDIPCGQCIGCRLDRSKEWAVRCMLEASQYKNNYFVTLTYDDDHLPYNDSLQLDTYGKIVTDIVPTLIKSHPADFIKRLRSYLKYHFNFDGLRVYYCGEYGSQTGRPHYHLILFNVPDGLNFTLYKRSRSYPLYNCKEFSSCWDKGFVVVGSCNYHTCAYTARYILKKSLGLYAERYFKECIIPEFTCMSRRPGIARSYYDSNSDRIYDFDKIIICGPDGKPLRMKPPRYYDKLFDLDDHEKLESVKKVRKVLAEARMQHILDNTSLSIQEYNELQEGNLSEKLKILIRPL